MSSNERRGAADQTSTERMADGPGSPPPPAERPGVSLVVYYRDGAEMAQLAPGKALVVGRCEPSDLCVPDRTLSREHARFTLLEGRVLVEDLGSTNGMWLDGKPVQRAEIALSGEVMLGTALARVVALGSGAPAVEGQAGRASTKQVMKPTPTEVWVESSAGADGEEMIAGAAMRKVFARADLVADSRLSILLHGESGTGKEVLAQYIHKRDSRYGSRMISVNCGAISDSLLESKLFGHKRGAFTGAVRDQPGMFEAAHEGTLFLDEVGELTLAAQKALLRVLEVGVLSPVGSNHEVKVDVRVIAATNRNLKEMVENGQFRKDLYYRLSGMVLEIPPLRERVDEIDRLAHRFVARANKENGRCVRGVSKEAMALLESYRWPGNVRELKNAMELAVVVARGDLVQLEDLPEEVLAVQSGGGETRPAEVGKADVDRGPPDGGTMKAIVRETEAQTIREALEKVGWSKVKAAKLLGSSPRNLARKMKDLGIERSKG